MFATILRIEQAGKDFAAIFRIEQADKGGYVTVVIMYLLSAPVA